MKAAILGKDYALSLVLCGDTLAQKLNRTYRNKEYKPNVLSFPLDRTEGEVFLNLRKAEREAAAAGSTANERIALLFVHACFHLKGYDHGDRMERAEERVLARFGY
ncbi:MAG TPA: rRNA maturation RNase YbeY [Candidatus Paceibacterota bacterium]|nr:rRNA maturation RNase YbeY [Candidatus Paceibacterota bacterium]